MKLKKYTAISLALACVFSSCTTVEKFTVEGTPGTKIYSPDKREIATIESNGKARIQLPSNAYYAYLYTHNDQNKTWIPFALETRKNKHSGTKFSETFGYTLASAGGSVILLGTIILAAGAANGDDDIVQLGGIIDGGGAVLGGVGAALGAPASSRMDQLSYQYNFAYLNTQHTNSDLILTQYVPTQTSSRQSSTRGKRGKASSAKPAAKQEDQPATPTSKASHSRKDPAKVAEGNYAGSGFLVQGNRQVEEIPDVEVRIVYVEKGKIKVEILEDSIPFFDSDEYYILSDNSQGVFTFTHLTIPQSKITIKGNKLSYTNPSVNIDDDIFVFNIESSK